MSITTVNLTSRLHRMPLESALGGFDSTGERLLTYSGSRVYLWSVPDRSLIATLEGHEGTVTAAVFSTDGKRVATGSDDAAAAIWDAQTGQLLSYFMGH